MSIFFTHLSDNNADGMRKITDSPSIETVVLDCFPPQAVAKTLFSPSSRNLQGCGGPGVVMATERLDCFDGFTVSQGRRNG